MRHAYAALLIAPLAAAAMGCGVLDMAKDMAKVSHCMADRAGTHSMNVKTSNKRLTVMLVNSPLDTLPVQLRIRAARTVATCMKENFSRPETFDEIAIGFERRTTTGPVNVSTSGDPVVFRMADLGAPADTTQAR